MSSRKIFSLLMVFAVAALAVGSASVAQAAKGDKKPELVLKAGHIVPSGSHYDLGLKRWGELVTERTNGRITLDVYPSSQLGNERDMIEGMQLGTVSMACTTTAPLSGFVPEFGALDIPYLFTTYEDARKVLDSEIGDELLAKLEANGIIGLAIWENGFRHVFNNKREAKTPEDFTGIKIRTMENPVFLSGFTSMGAIPLPMAWSEVFTALQQKTIDAMENNFLNTYQAKMHEVAPYCTLTYHCYSAATLVISKIVWDKLSPEDQKIMRDAAKEVTAYERKLVTDLDEECKQKMIAEGVKLVEVDLDLWRKAVQPTWDKFGVEYADFLKKVEAKLAQ